MLFQLLRSFELQSRNNSTSLAFFKKGFFFNCVHVLDGVMISEKEENVLWQAMSHTVFIDLVPPRRIMALGAA